MADTSSSIFNRRATEKLRSPDDLDKYVRVTNPSVWVILAACIVLLAALLVWGVFGAVTSSVTATGACVDGKAMCFLNADDAAKVHVGDSAMVGDKRMKVASVAAVPLSLSETEKVLKSDYLVSALVPGDWGYQVIFDGDASQFTQGVPISVTVAVERITPISLILRSRE